MNRRGGLGRGLAALIPPDEQTAGAQLRELPLGSIAPNPRQPRGGIDEDELEGLATSIREVGVLQPIVVREVAEDRFELIAGERRLRACRRADLETVPAVVREAGDDDLLKQALIENIHRVQLNPLEEAAAYRQLLDDFGFTQEELAGRLGRSRPAVSNSLRLLGLPQAVQRRLAAGVLSAGHAKALLVLPDAGAQERVADRIVSEAMSVRATEELVRLRTAEAEEADAPAATNARSSSGGGGRRLEVPGLTELQDDLSDALGTRVRIHIGARKGKVTIDFLTVDELEHLVGLIAGGLEAHRRAPSADG